MPMHAKHFRDASGIPRRIGLTAAFSAAAIVAGVFAAPAASAANKEMIIKTGSSLLYPLFNLWVPE